MTVIKISQPGFSLFISTTDIERAKKSRYTKPYPIEQIIEDLHAAAVAIDKHRKTQPGGD